MQSRSKIVVILFIFLSFYLFTPTLRSYVAYVGLIALRAFCLSEAAQGNSFIISSSYLFIFSSPHLLIPTSTPDTFHALKYVPSRCPCGMAMVMVCSPGVSPVRSK